MYSAKTLVLGTPLNNTAPERCGINKALCGQLLHFLHKFCWSIAIWKNYWHLFSLHAGPPC